MNVHLRLQSTKRQTAHYDSRRGIIWKPLSERLERTEHYKVH